MSIKNTLNSAVNTIFKTFKDIIKDGTYIVDENGDGWESTSSTSSEYPMETIVNGLSQRDLKGLSFYEHIQPTDTIVMIKGSDISKYGITVRSSDAYQITDGSVTSSYLVIAHSTDPANALYILLLREK